MSTRYYEKLWREAEGEFARVFEADREYVAQDLIEDRPKAYKQSATNYIRYIMCVNKLNLCLDQMVHAQKRQTVRMLLEAAMSRMLQVKQELVNQDVSDYSYLDGLLMDMKLTPYDVEIKVPRYYRRDRADKLAKLSSDIDRILEELANPPPSEGEEGEEGEGEEKEEGRSQNENISTEEGKEAAAKEAAAKEAAAKEAAAKEAAAREAAERKKNSRPPPFKKVEITESQKMFKEVIFLIQRHERARVSRLETQQLMEKKRIQRQMDWHEYEPIPEDTQNWAVGQIQRFWRGYCARHRAWHHRTQARLLMGELIPSWRSYEEMEKEKQTELYRHGLQKVADEEYEIAVQELEERIRRGDADVKDDIADHLRWYIEDWFRKLEELPEFPEADKIDEPEGILGWPKDTPPAFIKRMTKITAGHRELYPGLPPYLMGGSALIVAGFWIDPELWDMAHTVARLAKGKQAGKPPPKKEKLTKQQKKEMKEAEKEKKRQQNEAKKKELEEKRKRGVVPNPTDLMDPMARLMDRENIKWQNYEDVEWNPTQKHRLDLPTKEIAFKQQNELRDIVDDLMRLELERLQAALNRDRGKKKKGDKKKKKKKKGKGKKGKKDPTHDRTEESLLRELVEKGIVKKSPDIRLDDFFCDPPWRNYDLRIDPWWQNPPPNLWDVKQVVKEYGILPLGSATVHRSAPLIRSLLLAGFPDCGKKMLVDAIVAETGAVLFDLSPENTVGKYPGKKGLKMLVHLVTKMSRLMQPAVIFIDGGEKVFYKKVPKTEKHFNPKLLQKQLPKMVKAVVPDDQVLFVATAENPWMAKGKSMAKSFDKIIPVLPPDQSTSAHYWNLQLMQYHGVDRDFLYTPLAWCIQGFTLPTIDRIIRTLMTAERIIALKYRPLDPQELLDLFLKETPITPDQRTKLVAWFESTYPLAKKKAEKLKTDKELRDKLAAIEAKKNEQKKKKK